MFDQFSKDKNNGTNNRINKLLHYRILNETKNFRF